MSVPEAVSNLTVYFRFYNQERGHQVFDYQTPEAMYFQSTRSTASVKKAAILQVAPDGERR